MRVRTLFLVALLAVLLPGLAASAWIAGGAIAALRASDRAVALTEALGTSMRAAVATAVERGVLLTIAAGTEPYAAGAGAIRADAASRARARVALGAIGLPVGALVREESAITDLVAQLRAAHGAARPPLTGPGLARPTAVVDTLGLLDSTVQRDLLRVAPRVAAEAQLAGLVMSLRAVAGLRAGMLEHTWLKPDSAPPDLVARLDAMDGGIAQLWAVIRSKQAMLPPDAARARAIHALGAGFMTKGEAAFRHFVDLLRTHQATSLPAEAMHHQAVAWLATLQAPRDAALAGALREAGGMHDAAKLRLWLALAAATLALGIAAFAGWLLWRRVILSLGGLTGTIGRLAAGELDLLVPEQGRGDESGARATALETLRAGALAARDLAEQAGRAQQAKSAEAERVAALLGGFERGAAEATAGVAA
ncbi:MAG: hypothetical protein KGI51_07940, partial [Rhodospirillales bacterium]|nr:hypothetical protein [Rhodospirillales bacterium]